MLATAMVGFHLPVIGMGARLADGLGKLAHLGGGEKPVGADADEAELGANAAKSLFWRGVSANRIPGIHGAQNVDEAFSLVVEVAPDVKPAADETAVRTLGYIRIFAQLRGAGFRP